jgi:hypothetical protein
LVLSGSFGPGRRSTNASSKATLSNFPPVKYRPDQPDLRRSLFRAERAAVEEGEPANEPDADLSARLLGVVLTGEKRIALLMRGDVISRVEEGDELDGWKVSEIAIRRVRLDNGERHVDIALDAAAEPR